ncbi:hypothetical protein KY284_020253 [Solanum tuberosum]|nr:hypothetical protein KY284_020253 [Solanum tuberosum]
MESEKDISSYRKSIQRQRVHIFLAGLDGEFEQIRGEILRKDPVPELEECYSIVLRESVRHATVNGDLEKSKAAAMVRKYRSNQNRFSQNQPDRMRSKGINKSTYKCTHCDLSGHTKDRCFEIVGYLEWWDHNRGSRRINASKSSTAVIVETNAKEDVAGQSTALLATRGNNGKALNSSALVSNSTWIIDSGATDHMTFDSRQVSSLKPSSQKYISTANGSSAPIIGEGSLSLINNLNLDSVLVVPSLDCNLLFVSQITTTLSCIVMFWPDYCVFKDIQTRKTIGYGARQEQLYYLDLESKIVRTKQGNLIFGYGIDDWDMLLLDILIVS